MTNTYESVRFGRATTGTDYALFIDGLTVSGQPTLVPMHAIYGFTPDTETGDLAGARAGIAAVLAKMLAAPATGANQSTQITAEQAIQTQIGALTTPATGSSNKLLTDILAKYGIGLPSAFGSGGGIKVDIVSGAGSGGTAAADDADFTAGVTNGTPVMGIFENSPTSVTDGDLGTVGITVTRRLKTSTTIDAAIPAGTALIGKFSIDQATANANEVVVKSGAVNVCNKVVTVTAGTRVQMPSTACSRVTIIALDTNTGNVFAGASNVSSTVFGIKASDAGGFTFYVNNANLIWIDSSVSGEGFSYVIN
jgi:hypothetical protein